MDVTRFAALLRSLADPLGRRHLSRLLLGLSVGGPLGLRGLAEADAKRHKKKKRRRKKQRKKNQPFCAGKNFCNDTTAANCNGGLFDPCLCYVTSAGTPFCGTADLLLVSSCAECSPEETCIDRSSCGGGVACTTACPDPF
jgi:hypothetical protein